MKTDARQSTLFEIGPQLPRSRYIKRLQTPVWTRNKSTLIARYLRYFVFITKHGTYLDAFAGPQSKLHLEMWSARLVLENQPQWFRHFHLFENDEQQLKHLRTMVAEQVRPKNHDVRLHAGDCNLLLPQVLTTRCIGDREATFCLLDQRTFECQWRTVQALAHYKPVGQHKIELFYFLPIAWLSRAFAGVKNLELLDAWWGRSDWHVLRDASSFQRSNLFVDRFRNELGYSFVHSWPIMNRRAGRKIMYFMIHATDHPEAPQLMSRAYQRAIDPEEAPEQLELLLGRPRPRTSQ